MKKEFIKPQARKLPLATESILAGSTPSFLSMGKTTSEGGSSTYAPSTAD